MSGAQSQTLAMARQRAVRQRSRRDRERCGRESLRAV